MHTQATFRRTVAWVLAVMLVLGIGVITGFVRPAPLVAQDREIVVKAHADATVFGRFPRRNFGTRPRLVVGAYHGGSRTYLTFIVPATDLVIDDATLVLHSTGRSARINVRRVRPGWQERRITKVKEPEAGHVVGTIAGNRSRNTVDLDITRMIDGSRKALSFVLISDGERSVLASKQSAREPRIKIHGHTTDPTGTPSPTATPTTSPSPTGTPTPSPTTGGDAQPSMPIRAAFYYPWFPETWGPSSNPFTNYHPSAGLYDSSAPATIARAHRRDGVRRDPGRYLVLVGAGDEDRPARAAAAARRRRHRIQMDPVLRA